MSEVHSVTNVGESMTVRNSRRMRRYMVTMAIRCAGLIGAFYTEGWLRWLCVVLAVGLPYLAVALGTESVEKHEQATAYDARAPQLPAAPASGGLERGDD